MSVLDVFDKNKRSDVMRRVRSKNNKTTELRLIELFKENHITGWRRNYPIFGKPDFVFLNQKVAIFVDGCFWHGHDCRNVTPSNNAEFWQKKRAYNKEHDKIVTKKLEDRGWHVIRIWECQLKKKNCHEAIRKIISSLSMSKIASQNIYGTDNGEGK